MSPPLRERGDDVLLLAGHFLDQIARRYGRPPARLGPDARARLRAHAWPGNVRELRNLLEQVVIFHPGGAELGAADLPLPPAGTAAPRAAAAGAAPAADDAFVLPERGLDLDKLERSLTVQALERTGWNMTQAGRLLGLSRDAMRYRAEKYGLRAEAAGEA